MTQQWFYSGTVMDKEKRKQEVGNYFYLKKIAEQLSVSRKPEMPERNVYLPKNQRTNLTMRYQFITFFDSILVSDKTIKLK